MVRKPSPQSDEKQLEVKTKIIARMVKEVEHYKQETVEHEDRIAAMKTQGRDPYDVKKAVEVLEETKMMIPDSKRRLCEALDDLEQFIDGGGPNLESHSSYSQAQRYLASRDELV